MLAYYCNNGTRTKEITARAEWQFFPILETIGDFLSSLRQIAHFSFTLNLVTKFAYFPLNLRVKYHKYKLKYMKPITFTAFRMKVWNWKHEKIYRLLMIRPVAWNKNKSSFQIQRQRSNQSHGMEWWSMFRSSDNWSHLSMCSVWSKCARKLI